MRWNDKDIIVVARAFRELWRFEGSKTADITICQRFSAVSRLQGSWAACTVAVVCVFFCLVLGALFGSAGHFFLGGGRF